MKSHHLIKQAYSASHCIYCNDELKAEQWSSEFDLMLHYKAAICKCGKKNVIRMRFYSSGNDNWSSLEKKVNCESERQVIKKSKSKK